MKPLSILNESGFKMDPYGLLPKPLDFFIPSKLLEGTSNESSNSEKQNMEKVFNFPNNFVVSLLGASGIIYNCVSSNSINSSNL